MQLVIAEKPSVARDLARVLGLRSSGKGLLEGPGRVITWCIGHLVELEEPAAYEPAWKAWRMDVLPMIPSRFNLRPVPSTQDQLRVVRALLRDRKFTEVVNACDAGREGELIFRYVYELAGSRLPVRRLWISSLTDEAIREGFSGLRPGASYDALADAARCRSEADWLVGMNATRAVTIRFRSSGGAVPPTGPATGASAGRAGHRHQDGGATVARRRGSISWRSSLPPVYSIGRVQTPTLAIMVRREQTIRSFEPRPYWEIRGTFAPGHAPRGQGEGEGLDESEGEQTGAAGDDAERASTFTALWNTRIEPERRMVARFARQHLAEEVVTRIRADGAAVVESLEQKLSREPPPQLFDLTSLQRTANRRHGFSASRTLELAQALYERHKLVTYPRTDSRYLPRDLAAELPKLFRGLAHVPTLAPFAQPLLEQPGALDLRRATRRIFDDARVHDHHAIIPTGKTPNLQALDEGERRLFDLIARRFLGAFHPDAELALTEVVIRVGRPDDKGKPDQVARREARAGSAPGPRRGQFVPAEEAILEVLPPPPDRFNARGRVRLVAGWQAVAGFEERTAGAQDAALPPLSKGQRLQGRFEILANQTRPPPRHTEATLLGAMESAGREIEDETLRAAMKDAGLGTPATRAATIETLVKRGFVARDGKQISATPTGIDLIERLPVPSLASPELTGAWEARLARIARGQETRAAFMIDIGYYIREVIDAIRDRTSGPVAAVATAAAKPTSAAIAKPRPAPATKRNADRHAMDETSTEPPELTCPRCGLGKILAGKRGWGCTRWKEGCSFVVWFEVAGKRITEAQLRDLVARGKTRKAKWTPAPAGQAPQTGRLVLDLGAARESGAARFVPG